MTVLQFIRCVCLVILRAEVGQKHCMTRVKQELKKLDSIRPHDPTHDECIVKQMAEIARYSQNSAGLPNTT